MSERSFHDSALSISGSIILGAVVIAAAILWTGGVHGTTGNTIGAGTPLQAGAQTVDSGKVNTVGEPFIGNPSAPVTIAYWFDYQCPFCRQNEETVMPSIISDYVNTGKVKIVFKDFAFLGPDSTTLSIAARAVWDVDPTNFYAWHKAIFDNQGEENSGWATTAKIMQITTSVLGASEAAQVQSLITSNATKYQSEIAADKTEGASFGITGTPAMVIGTQLVVGAEPYANIKSAIDTALASN